MNPLKEVREARNRRFDVKDSSEYKFKQGDIIRAKIRYHCFSLLDWREEECYGYVEDIYKEGDQLYVYGQFQNKDGGMIYSQVPADQVTLVEEFREAPQKKIPNKVAKDKNSFNLNIGDTVRVDDDFSRFMEEKHKPIVYYGIIQDFDEMYGFSLLGVDFYNPFTQEKKRWYVNPKNLSLVKKAIAKFNEVWRDEKE